MLDPKILRNDLEGVTKILATRGYVFDVARYQELEVKRKEVQDIAQQLQNEKNVSGLSTISDDVIIVTSSLTKDMTGKEDSYRAAAIRYIKMSNFAMFVEASANSLH